MIQVEKVGPVRKFVLARSLFGRAVYFTTAYWVDGLLVDTGCAHTAGELMTALDGLAVERLVNTHGHEDHIGANAALQDKYGLEALAYPLALPVLAAPRARQRLKPYQVVMWGYPAPSRAKALGGAVETERYRFEVLHTPGHSADHVSLYEPRQGWLFCGDAFVGGRDRALRADYNIWQIMASLAKMAALDLASLFPGSGRVRPKPQAELKDKIRYLEETAERVLELHRRGWSYRRIRRRLFGREGPICYFTLGHFSGSHLVRSFVEDRPGDAAEE